MERLTLGLLTYLLHSTVVLGGAALLRQALGERRLALQEAVLRAALVGGVVTASLQVGLGFRPMGGVVVVPASPAAVVTAVPVADAGTAAANPLPEPVGLPRATGKEAAEGDSQELTAAAWPGPWIDAVARLWRPALTAGWSVLAILALARLAVAGGRLRSLLRDRRPLEQRDVGWQTLAVAEGLGLRGPLRLSAAPRLAVPLARGVLRPEVCLPTRALREMAPEERTALCAHELAHLARRDPAWVLLARLLEALAPLQPLNWWARRRLQDLAECLSDDLAVAASARPLGLARSLVDVASWAVVGRSVPPALAAGALSAPSRLGLRVERLMDPLRALERPRRFLLPMAAAAVVAAALVMPVVSGSAVQGPETPASVPQTAPEPAPQPEPAATPKPETSGGVKGGVKGGGKGGVSVGVEGRVADDRRRSDAERELERLTEKLEQRAYQHQAEIERLEAEIEALAAKIKPNEQEMERLGQDMEAAARQMAELVAAEKAPGKAAGESEELAAARRQLEQLRVEMKAKAGSIRLPEEEVRQIREKARALAELAKPSEQELRELQRAAAELARQSLPDAAEMSPATSQAVDRAREQVRRSQDELRRAQDEVRRATFELQRAVGEARRAAEEARRARPPE